MPRLLEVAGLTIRYPLAGGLLGRFAGGGRGFLDAVLDISFSIDTATTFGLLGESGSGKSSLARALLGLVPASAGAVRFDGAAVDLASQRSIEAYRRQVVLMFQDPVASLSPRLTVRSLVTEPFAIHGVPCDPDAECRRLLDMVGLPRSFASRYPHQLSGGQARRIGVARALALDPRLIVADEPTAGLDVSAQGDILNLLGDLRSERGVSFLIVTHNLAVARHVCDETAVMYMGRFVERGPTAALFEAPQHPYTSALIAAQPVPDPHRRGRPAPLAGEVPSLISRPSGCEFHTRCPRAQELCRTTAPVPAGGRAHEFRCHFPLRGREAESLSAG